MGRSNWIPTLIAVVGIIAGLIGWLRPGAQPAHQLPTATEVFNLRSKCVELGQQILEGNHIGSALTQSQISNYDPRANRCYVELKVQSADPSEFAYFNQTIYDGQTQQMLAFAKIEKAQRVGMVFDTQYQGNTGGWDAASAYIDKMMAADRR